ncbi:hypothetical protein BJP36_40720 [Moorena producens JHB]|uniref:Uncharacterized protein n=1 Tax=Moorena producens (strain JHB) TaxID=1454205 RepID=A0A9Q9SS66_MOOP1|nr:hypothetical protein [Moorena producens]WAN68692.1 hypothetical protein BJP36_40720 [Moorena producens JHB]
MLNFGHRLPTPNSLLPTPDSQLPTPDSLLPTPYSRLPTPHLLHLYRSFVGYGSSHSIVRIRLNHHRCGK